MKPVFCTATLYFFTALAIGAAGARFWEVTFASTIQIFATGEGLTNPPGRTGSIATGQHRPLLPVGVKIGGTDAQIVYEGSAPTEIQGLFQINAVVPVGSVAEMVTGAPNFSII